MGSEVDYKSGEEMTSSKPLFTFLLNAAQLEALQAALASFYEEHGEICRVRAFAVSDIEEELVPLDVVRRALIEAQVVFLDVRGGGRAAGLAAATLSQTQQPVLVLVGGSPEILRLARLGSFSMAQILARSQGRTGSGSRSLSLPRVQQFLRLIEKGGSLLPFGRLRHARNWARAVRYWLNGGRENIKNLLVLVGREYAGLRLPKPAPPCEFPELGIYDVFAGRYYQKLADYLQARGYQVGGPTVGLLFYGGMHFEQSVVPAKALARVLQERHNLQVIPVFAVAGRNLQAIEQFFFLNGQPCIDALVYFQWFQLTSFSGEPPEATQALLQRLNVPVFNAAPLYGRKIADWEATVQGFSPVETLTAVILPELDGMIEPLPTAGLEEREEAFFGGRVRAVAPITDRIERLAARVARWIRLRRLPNQEKRVAFIIYNYPPGEDNLGSAAYLDVFASLREILAALQTQGYKVGPLPEADRFADLFLGQGLVNTARWLDNHLPLQAGKTLRNAAYTPLWQRLPAAAELASFWGPPPGDIMVTEGELILPYLEFGHILIGIQPARGYHDAPETISHDQTLPPHHQYVAFYRWLEEVWRPDVLVHVGTHGTLEFLKGKEVGLSQKCWPENLLGSLPHLYLYHVVNASEATIAKRRSLGVLVNYNSPSFAAAGLYDDYATLDDLIGEYWEARQLDPGRSDRLAKIIQEKAQTLNLTASGIPEIQEELLLLKRAIIPKGLHIFGKQPGTAEAVSFASLLLRYERGTVPSLHRLVAARKGVDYEELLRHPGKREAAGQLLAQIDAEVEEMVQRALLQGEFPSDPDMRQALTFAQAVVNRWRQSREISNLLRGLAGEYIEPGLGGDPLRNPEVLPTGRNSYQFDPRFIPSAEALQRGAAIARQTLEHYYEQHGAYPASTAVVLWGFETTKTRGETIGQILAYLGVTIEPQANPWYKKLTVIPLAELGRPRIDCLVQICGFFRDMFPNLLDLLNRAFSLVAELEEPPEQNFVRRQTEALLEQLPTDIPLDRRRKIAVGRIFGPKAGEYGTRTVNLIESGAWQREEDITQLFVNNMCHLYGPNLHGEACLAAYEAWLRQVELVSQVRDSHEYEIMDLDHYYEFFGGLARSIEAATGRRPTMLITDTTKEVIRTETVGEALQRGLRTRLLNPQWIEDLLQHQFHGGQKISDRVENLIGFAATTHAVDNWVFSAVAQRYILDETMFRRLAANNRFAAEAVIKRLLEAAQRGYWQASEEELQALRERYLELEGLIEEQIEP